MLEKRKQRPNLDAPYLPKLSYGKEGTPALSTVYQRISWLKMAGIPQYVRKNR